MTNLEVRFMESIPYQLKSLADALSPHMVKVSHISYLNPNQISSIDELPASEHDNKNGGRVNITMVNGDIYSTTFLTIAETFKALGIS